MVELPGADKLEKKRIMKLLTNEGRPTTNNEENQIRYVHFVINCLSTFQVF